MLVWLALVSLVMVALAAQVVVPPTARAMPGPIRQPSSTTVTADSLPTAQVNGVVFAQVVAGSTVFAGGQFTATRPAGAPVGRRQSRRYNLMSYDLVTGVATSFAPELNGVVRVLILSGDRTTLYVGGQFTRVDGVRRDRFAAFSLATRRLTSLAPDVDSTVHALAAVGHVLYLGGSFNQVNGRARSRLAAVNTASGRLTAWSPVANATVRALVVTPDRRAVIAAGNFATISRHQAHGMGSLDAVTGAVRRWQANTIIKDYGDRAAIATLSVDRDTVYGGGYTFGLGGGNFEGVFAADPSTGSVTWLQDCHGDTYGVAALGDQIYSVSHAHFCSNIGGFPDTLPRSTWHRALAVTRQATGRVSTNTQPGGSYGNFAGRPAPSLYNWFPDLSIGTFTGLSQAAWSVAGNSRYVVLGGEFPRVNGVAQQGLARFADAAHAPDLQGPRVTGGVTTPTATKASPRSLVLRWSANWDRDDQQLSYDVLRDGVLLQTVVATSQFWQRPTLTYVDRNGQPGVSYRYRIRARDPHDNSVTSPYVSASFPSDPSYAERVRADGAAHQWRLGSSPGETSEPDTVGSLPLTTSAGVAFGAPGAIAADADTAATFDGAAAAPATSNARQQPGGAVSIEAWFRTTSTTGGGLVGFAVGDRSAPSSTGDRQLYLDSTGRVAFAAALPGLTAPVTVTSPGSLTDGGWHQVIGVHAPDGLQLYVDGVRVADTTAASLMPDVSGSWSLGGPAPPEDLTGGSQASYAGALDEVAVYDSALTPLQVHDHYQLGSSRFWISGVTPGQRR